MRLKSYFANSVHDAMEKARLELGADAMLISSRQTGIDLKDLGAYEVVFGLSQINRQALASPTQERPVVPETLTSQEAVLRELAELRRQMDLFGQSVARSSLSQATSQFTPDLARLFDRLLHAGFSAELARELAEAVSLQSHPHAAGLPPLLRDHRDLFTRDLLHAMVNEEVASRFAVDPALGDAAQDSATVMFVGPPGSGKTSSLVKLGLQYGLKAKRPLHFLSLDTLRIGGCDQLSRYARIGGVEFRPVDEFSGLPAALSERPRRGLTLIDTPGFARADEEDLGDLAQIVRNLEIEVQLVLPAYLRLETIQQICSRYECLLPAKLIVTHMDSAVPATAIELAIRSQLPLSFFGTGQQVPEDVRQAQKDVLIGELMPREKTASMAA